VHGDYQPGVRGSSTDRRHLVIVSRVPPLGQLLRY
jgi:hypothetical protein